MIGPALRNFFEVEIRNEILGGVTPSTLSSAIDSLAQAPVDVINDWLLGDEVAALTQLLSIRDREPGSTHLWDFL